MFTYPHRIIRPFTHPFTVATAGLYTITINAICRSGRQINQPGGEDLRVEIDSIALREIPAVARTQEYDIPPAWNGTQLCGLSKTVVFVLRLETGNHQINFIPYRGAEIVAEPKIELVSDPHSLSLIMEQQAEDSDRRPWYTISLVNLPLQRLTIDATAKWHLGDSDDIKIIVDNAVKPNPSSLAILRRDWLISGSLLKKLFKNERQQFNFEENLNQGIHYIELWADREPIIHSFELDLGDIEIEEPAQRTPTVDDPKWTGNFDDDSETILLARLIFGEAEGESREAKTWVGASVLNRVRAQTWWGKTLREVILKPAQYDPFGLTDERFKTIINPMKNANSGTVQAWHESYTVAEELLSGKISIPTEATHFHGIGIVRDEFIKKVVPNGRFLRQIDNTFFYWSPN
ncbi:MAG: cell wall hydrolase [bacterium]|nr:cell wall hydrolase [bacterium]